MKSLRICPCILAATWTLGCASPEGSSGVGITPRPIPGCESESYTPCAPSSEACQEAVFSAVSCLRGQSRATRPTSRTVTASEYGRELAASAGEEDPRETQAYEDAYVLLGLAKPGDLSLDSRVAVSTATVPALYNSQTKQITFVVPDGKASPVREESAYIVLAHEYAHALQDQEHDLGALQAKYSTSTDGALALRSLIEGEAEVQGTRFLAASWGLDPEALDWSARYASFAEWEAEALADIAPVLAIWRSFPYEAGGLYVRRAFASGGMPAVRALFADPPRASITITSDIAPNPVEAAPPKPPDGYTVLSVDTLGAELFHASISKQATLAGTQANLMGAEWRGDRLYIYRNGNTGAVIVLWRLRFATEAPKNMLLSTTTAFPSVTVEGDVMLGFSTDQNATTALATCFENATRGIAAPEKPSNDPPVQAHRLPRWLRLVLAR